MLRSSLEPDAVEYAIHDYQNFEGVEIHEYDSIESVCELAQYVVDHGKLGAMVLEYCGSNIEEAEAAFDQGIRCPKGFDNVQLLIKTLILEIIAALNNSTT